MKETLIDTDILSYYFKGDRKDGTAYKKNL